MLVCLNNQGIQESVLENWGKGLWQRVPRKETRCARLLPKLLHSVGTVQDDKCFSRDLQKFMVRRYRQFWFDDSQIIHRSFTVHSRVKNYSWLPAVLHTRQSSEWRRSYQLWAFLGHHLPGSSAYLASRRRSGEWGEYGELVDWKSGGAKEKVFPPLYWV